jgi:hypothetical protein
MKTMNMPGFTAEVSLYKTTNHYHMIEAVHQADGTVHAALIGNCFRDCFRACRALGESGWWCSSICQQECY